MNKEFKPSETKKCTIDNLHPNWENQELTDEMIVEEEENQNKDE